MAAPEPMPTPRLHAPSPIELVAGLLPPAAVAVLRVLAPQQLGGLDPLGWAAIVACGLAALGVGLGTVALGAGMMSRQGAAAAAPAAGLGAVTVGLALAALGATGDPARLPGPELAISAVGGGLLILASVALPDRPATGRTRSLMAAIALFVLLEAILGAALLARGWVRSTGTSGWLLAGGAGAAFVAFAMTTARPALRDRAVPASLPLAGSLAALALARPGTADVGAGLLGLLVAGGLAARGALIAAAAAGRDAEGEPGAEPELPPVALLPDAPAEATPDEPRESEEHAARQRLARELRGTIEELLQARRIIELQREEIARATNTDPLTGLPNRRAILERLRVEVAEARRYAHPVAVALLDIDGFGGLNTAHGLAVGDALLREVALRVRLRIRAADALGRIGADGFLAILPHTDERGAATFVGTLLRRLTGRAVATDAGELPLSISVGVALIRPGMDLREEGLLAAAEEALNSARAAGGNRIAFDRLHGLARIEDKHS